ncbi:MAG TPA: hypothetical protein VNM47_19495 [Terriglobia bacterium]|nr:hypothetical protein [Terriglobia bacterium]
MDSTIAGSSHPPYKDRGGWLVAFGVVEILLGASSLLIGVFVLISQQILKTPHETGMPGGAYPSGILVGAGFYVVTAAFFLIAGVGSALRCNWARILMLIGSIVWMFVGALATLFLLFLFPRIMAIQKPAPPAAQHVEHIVMGGIVSMAIVFVLLLPLTFLIFYSRKSVKATFLAREGTTAGTGTPSRELPVPVILLVVWEALGAISMWPLLISPVRTTFLFGYILRGWTVVVLMLAFSALSAAAAWLIYRKRLAGWTISFWKLLFFGASAGVSFLTGSVFRLFVEMGQTPGREKFAQLFPQFVTVVMVGSLVICAVYLALLIYWRRFFLSAKPSAASLYSAG